MTIETIHRVDARGLACPMPIVKTAQATATLSSGAPIVVERIVAAVEGRAPDAVASTYTGKVMCFFEVGDGKGTLLQFDDDHPPKPPKPPKPNRLWHLGKVVFNRTYWHTVPKGRV